MLKKQQKKQLLKNFYFGQKSDSGPLLKRMMQQVLPNPRVSDLSDKHKHKLFYQELQQT